MLLKPDSFVWNVEYWNTLSFYSTTHCLGFKNKLYNKHTQSFFGIVSEVTPVLLTGNFVAIPTAKIKETVRAKVKETI